MKFSDYINKQSNNINGLTRAVIAPGRFNPPHRGHSLIITELQKLSRELNATPYVLIIDSGKRSESNPLDGETRLKYLKQMFPNMNYTIAQNAYEGVISLAEQFNVVPVGSVTGEDRADSYKHMVARALGEAVDLTTYKTVILKRNPDAEISDVTGFSATKLREAIAKKDIPLIRTYTGLNRDAAKELMESVLNTEVNQWPQTIMSHSDPK